MALDTSHENAEPAIEAWKVLGELIATENRSGIRQFLTDLEVDATALVVSRLESAELNQLLDLIDCNAAVLLVDRLPDVQARGILERLPAQSAARIVEKLPEERHGGLIRKLGEKGTAALRSMRSRSWFNSADSN